MRKFTYLFELFSLSIHLDILVKPWPYYLQHGSFQTEVQENMHL